MKRKLFLMLALTVIACCFFALSVNAASTNEFGTVEISETIDLTGMSTDTKALVVLFDGTEYHTYPAQYIVTNAGDITLNFDKINEAFGKSYSTENDSVIRIEIPNTVKVIVSGVFNYGSNNSLKEVVFRADSQVYKFIWGCFEGNTSLEKINLPASLTELHGQNHFAKCSSLKYVSFDEGYSVSYIPINFMQSCSSIEEIVFPNCVTEIRGGAFGSCGKLKKIVFGNSLKTMGGSMSDCATSGSVWYLPASFYASDVTSEPPSNMFHWAGGQTNGVSGNENNPKNITFVYTGTKAQAEALQVRFKAADAATGENCVGLKRIYDAVLCTEAEYMKLTGKNIGEIASGYYLVYGYSACDAFYGSQHAMAGKESANVTSFFEPITIGDSCTRAGCGKSVTTRTIDAIFTYHGYSYTEAPINGKYAMSQSFSVNHEGLEEYTDFTGTQFTFGVVASSINNPLAEENSQYIGTKTIIVTSLIAHQHFDIKVSGITQGEGEDPDLTSSPLVFCAYVIDGDKTFYLDNKQTLTELEGKSFNDVKNNFANTNPIK